MVVLQKNLALILALLKKGRNFPKSRFQPNLKSLYCALEHSYDIETMWNRKILKNRNFLLRQPFLYDILKIFEKKIENF